VISPEPPAFVAESPPIVGDAYRVAAVAHEGQRRKGRDRPYIEHPLRVAALLREAGFDEEVIAAALLHDVVEDSEMSIEEVAKAFGARVAELVGALTEEGTIEPYEHRKDAHRAQVEAAGRDAAAIYAADKLSNVRHVRAAYSSKGESIAHEFKAPLDLRIRLWEDDLAMLRRVAPDLPFLNQLADELERLKTDRELAPRQARTLGMC
jgi:guanosine-3',5'-bis(diphosphate) 3'-pyrophosphohydrolase